jgi:hypothetical protein
MNINEPHKSLECNFRTLIEMACEERLVSRKDIDAEITELYV